MNEPNWFGMASLLAVVVYCIAQAIRDIRAKRFAWAAAAGVAALLLLMTPVGPITVKVTLPPVH